MTNWLLAAILLSSIQNGDVSNRTSEPSPCQPIIHSHSSRVSKGMKVEHVNFVGKTALPIVLQDRIAESLKAQIYPNDHVLMEEVAERLRDAWQEQGYFQATFVPKVSGTVEDSPLQTVVALTVNVEAGNQYRLGEIDFRQFTQFSAAELRSLFPIQQGDVFDTHKMQKGIAELRKAYGAKGFVNFTAIPSITIDENTAVASLAIEADEGREFHIGQVNVLGVDSALAQKLLNEAGLVAGRVFESSRLSAFFENNKPLLPENASEDQNTQRHFDEARGVVDVTIDFRGCVPESPF